MSEVIVRDKAEYHARTTEQMERHLAVPPWSLRQTTTADQTLCPLLVKADAESPTHLLVNRDKTLLRAARFEARRAS
jgi:hypothetical protein